MQSHSTTVYWIFTQRTLSCAVFADVDFVCLDEISSVGESWTLIITINFIYPRIYRLALLLISSTYPMLEIIINGSYIQIYPAILSIMFKTIFGLEQLKFSLG